MTTSVATRPRRTFPEISAVSWEHPADRAALQALRAVPGVDEVIRKVLALLGGERGVRLLFQGNAVRVGPNQFPKLWHMHTEVTTTFDWADVPELYVSQTPFFNAGAYGIDKPFIVIHSAAIELLDDDELRVLLSHELGHVMSGHALYRTIAAILAMISLGRSADAGQPGGASGAARISRVVAEVGAVGRSGGTARRPGRGGGAAGGHEDGGRRPGRRRSPASSTSTPSWRRPTSMPPPAKGSTWSTRCSARSRSPTRCTRFARPSCSAGSPRATTTGSCGASTCGAGPETTERPVGDDFAAAGSYYAGEAKEIATQVADAARRAAERARDAFRNAQKP